MLEAPSPSLTANNIITRTHPVRVVRTAAAYAGGCRAPLPFALKHHLARKLSRPVRKGPTRARAWRGWGMSVTN